MNILRKIAMIAILGLSTIGLSACSQVEPGNVGVEVSKWGGSAGVNPEPRGVGTYFTGLGTSIHEYPVSTQTYVWTRSSQEGKDVNEEFPFNDSNGMSATADIGMSYHIVAEKAPALYQKYKLDTDGLIAGPIRNAIRNALIGNASTMSIEEIYGGKKVWLLTKTQEDVRKVLTPLGIEIEQIYWAGGPRVPEAVMNQINQKIANEQQALAAKAAVETAKAQAEAKIATAEGDAKATQIEGEAIRTNPQILQQRWIEKWNGELPHYVAGQNSSLLMQVPNK